MAANRNKSSGNSWELQIIKDIKHIYPEAVSSRSESRNMDNKKVDVCFTKDVYIQAKCLATKADYPTILEEMPKEKGKTNVVIHKYTRKSKKNFTTQGKYAIMKYEDFIAILEKLNNVNQSQDVTPIP
jgi:hypothetical protein